MIAVDMLTHTVRGNMDSAVLLTGDLDFQPVIEALVQEGMYVTLWYDKNNTNEELIYSADESQKISVNLIHNWIKDNQKDYFIVPNVFSSNIPQLSTDTILIDKGSIINIDSRYLLHNDKLIELYWNEKYNRFVVNIPLKNDFLNIIFNNQDRDILESFLKEELEMDYIWD